MTDFSTQRIISKIARWKESALDFAKECLHVNPTKQQEQFLAAAGKEKRITIRSGHGCGKDGSASWAGLWFMSTRPYAKVVCTAPTGRQLSDILWSEFSKWLRSSEIADDFVIQKDKIFNKAKKEEWWIRAISPSVKASKEEQAETLAGLHGDHILVIVDEASGIPDPTFIPLEGIMTQEDNRCVLIGNMTKNKGYFYDSHFHSTISKLWYKLHWDSRESSIVSPTYPTYMATKYGLASNVFRIRVMGEPPLADYDTLIPLAWAIQCVGNDIIAPEDEPLYLGVDVARYGDDDSVVLPRVGNIIKPWGQFNGMNTISLAGYVSMQYQELCAMGVAIDEIGIGAGVVDWLMKKNLPRVFGVNVANASSNIEQFHRLRDELWCMVRDKCRDAKYNFPDLVVTGETEDKTETMGQRLCNELSSPKYDFNEHGGIKVESKRDMKTRGIMSPNIADALCLTEYFNNAATRIFVDPKMRAKVKRPWDKALQNQYGTNYAPDLYQLY